MTKQMPFMSRTDGRLGRYVDLTVTNAGAACQSGNFWCFVQVWNEGRSRKSPARSEASIILSTGRRRSASRRHAASRNPRRSAEGRDIASSNSAPTRRGAGNGGVLVRNLFVRDPEWELGPEGPNSGFLDGWFRCILNGWN